MIKNHWLGERISFLENELRELRRLRADLESQLPDPHCDCPEESEPEESEWDYEQPEERSN